MLRRWSVKLPLPLFMSRLRLKESVSFMGFLKGFIKSSGWASRLRLSFKGMGSYIIGDLGYVLWVLVWLKCID